MRRTWLALALALGLVACSSSSSEGSGHEEVRNPDPSVTRTSEATTTTASSASPTMPADPPTGAAAASTTTAPRPGTSAAPPPPLTVKLTKVADVSQPTAMAWCPQPLVAEKTGRVRQLGGGVVLDLSREVSTGGEQGLLGLACRGDALYVNYTNRAGDTRVEEVRGGQRRTLLAIDQPAPNHNGGNIAFGPDGKLWVGMGDGGGADDQYGHAQREGDPLGSMLRLDPADPKPEIMAKGLRNPWRWSFDTTGELWIGDVGQGEIEEINRLPAGFTGANLGWPAYEGSERYKTSAPAPPSPVMPVHEYRHDRGRAVVGGHVYRGQAIPALVGRYVFSDTYSARLWVLGGPDLGGVPGGLVSSFAQDPNRELYVLSLGGGIYRLDQG